MAKHVSKAKAFTISAPSSTGSIVLDGAGNFYTACGNGIIYVYTAPFTASSQPQVAMPIPRRPQNLNLAISP